MFEWLFKKDNKRSSAELQRDTFKLLRKIESLEVRIESLCRSVSKYSVEDPVEYKSYSNHGYTLKIGVIRQITTNCGSITYYMHGVEGAVFERDITRKVKVKSKK